LDSDLPRLGYPGQSISYHHLMLIQVDKVESVYVDLQVSHALPRLRALGPSGEWGPITEALGSSHFDAKDDNERLKRTYSPNQPL
jgi:hypothetical protein